MPPKMGALIFWKNSIRKFNRINQPKGCGGQQAGGSAPGTSPY